MLSRQYPQFQVHEKLLASKGQLSYYGELFVRPPGGTIRYPVILNYPEGGPFELPSVTPVESLPKFNPDGSLKENLIPKVLDHRHQMPDGSLCLFQRETRGIQGGEGLRGVDILRRAEQWLLGHHTDHWPPDCAESELEAHFRYSGDILLSKSFFSSELKGCGRFFMVRDLRRIVDAVSDDKYPLIVTAITALHGQSAIEIIIDAREDLSKTYPWIHNEAWNPESFVIQQKKAEGSVTEYVTEIGYWWSLPQEPNPFHDGSGFLRELEPIAVNRDAWNLVSLMLNTDLGLSTGHFFGLCYPGRNRETEWLILYMYRGERTQGGGIILKDQSEKKREFEQTQIGCYRVHTLRPMDLRRRNKGVVDNNVENKTVALIGLGALGSSVAEILAKAGIGHFLICDYDTLSTGNVARHIGGLNDFGAKKTRVVASRLLNINPYINIKVKESSAVNSLEELAKFIGSADLTISTTADENVESAINQIAVLRKKVVLYGRALRKGSIGRVFLVRPGIDACKACLGHYARMRKEGEVVPNDWIDISESEYDILFHECGRPVIPASAVDLSFITSLIARVALDELENKNTKENHWIWARLPALDVDVRLNRSMKTLQLYLERQESCYACREPDITELIITDDVNNSIISLTESSLNTETGGILIGFVDEHSRAIILKATGPGPSAIKSATRFSRDIQYVQKELDQATDEFGTKGMYIGEWHSHLEISPNPSSTDIESMFGIAQAPNYLTRCPVMIIAGLDNRTGKVVNLSSWVFPVGGRIYPIKHRQICSSGIEALHPIKEKLISIY